MTYRRISAKAKAVPPRPNDKVYLLCFSQPVGRARHYIGHSTQPIEARLAQHRAGKGARLTRQLMEQGGDFQLANLWENASYTMEQEVKNRGASAFCNVCRVERASQAHTAVV